MSDLVSQTPTSNLEGASRAAQAKTARERNRDRREGRRHQAAPLASPRPARCPADGHPRHHRREYRAPPHRRRPATERLEHQLDDHELLADLRESPAVRRPRGRSPRRRRMFLTGLGVFTALFLRLGDGRRARRRCSLLARVRGSARGLSPAALSIVTAAFHGTHRAKALAAWGAVGGAGAAIGVILGGVLTEFADWRMIFYINLPVAALLLFALLKVVPADARKPRWRGLDLAGAALATTSLAAVVYGITQADSAGWTSTRRTSAASAGWRASSAFADLRAAHRRAAPSVDRVADRAVGGGLLLMLLAAGSIFGLFLLCSLYLQGVLHMGPLATGLAFIPLAALGRDRRSPRRSRNRKARRAQPLAGAFLVGAIRDDSSLPRPRERQLPQATFFPAWWLPVSVSASQLSPSPSRSSPGPVRKRRGCCPASTPPATRSVARSASPSSRPSPPGRAARSSARTPPPGSGTPSWSPPLVATLGGLVAIAVLRRARHFLPKMRLKPLAMPVH